MSTRHKINPLFSQQKIFPIVFQRIGINNPFTEKQTQRQKIKNIQIFNMPPLYPNKSTILKHFVSSRSL